jgi:isobutyryl-CoA mutase
MRENAPQPQRTVRIVTATSLFDGHDATINIIRRLLQAAGAEVIHLGHDRSAAEIVEAAIQEDAQAIAVSSYQGGHLEFFQYMLQLLDQYGARHIKIFGGGGGVIVPEEVRAIQEAGVARIFTPEDGRRMGLQGMVNHMLEQVNAPFQLDGILDQVPALAAGNSLLLGRCITAIEETKSAGNGALQTLLDSLPARAAAPVMGITGTGGAGKSSLTDELVTRFLNDFADKTVAVLSVDPTRRRTGGALLGDRIRMNSLRRERVFMRSLATRGSRSEVNEALPEILRVVQAAGFDVIIVETAGIGQGDSDIVPLADLSVYVMTAEYGAPTQLEKIDMLDFADIVAINKFDRPGSEDALRHVRKQYQRNRQRFDAPLEAMPVYGTIAARFNDDGVTALYHAILDGLREKTGVEWQSSIASPDTKTSTGAAALIPADRRPYLADVAKTVRDYRGWVAHQAGLAEQCWHLEGAQQLLQDTEADTLRDRLSGLRGELHAEAVKALEAYRVLRESYRQDELVYHVRDREIHAPMYRESLSGTRIPRVALPDYTNPADQLRWMLLENVPGHFPYTAGVFPFKRMDEDPTRMFAGEGDAARTNRRFHFLSRNSEAKRLSTAFDSVTLYGRDPDTRPDIYGKVGTSGVSICTLDDMKTLYSGFDLCAPNTSVSMTINGPAPIILAMFLNTAIDQQVARFERETGRVPSAREGAEIRERTLRQVRGTVQADILKEDQGQNTCIFATDFALRMMGDVQEYFCAQGVRNFYSISISGYHIAEAGANPISQLAFTLANGFTYVEYFLARGLPIDAFAPNLSFFFSNGMDPEYTVINRVARRIWAIAMKRRYGANARSQQLKAHIQTSGRSLHAQEFQFNDIRTTLQALTALYDNCNSLHTNAYDEAITTPSEESVRRAMAIQLIITNEYGLMMNENPLQGSYILNELTELVEEAVLLEFDRLSERGGVLGAMELGYQRSKIQEESLYYESRKADGTLPIIGVNTFLNPEAPPDDAPTPITLARGTEEERQSQLQRLREFQARHANEAPRALKRLQEVAISGGNIFEELMQTARTCSLGQITGALFEVGGQYRRNM